jgi:hypothetical protein
MIWKLISGCLILGIASCGLCNQKKKEQKMTNMNEGKGIQLEIVDNVSSELWKLHPTLHFMRGELMAMAKASGDYSAGSGLVVSDSAIRFWRRLVSGKYQRRPVSFGPGIFPCKIIGDDVSADNNCGTTPKARAQVLCAFVAPGAAAPSRCLRPFREKLFGLFSVAPRLPIQPVRPQC